MSIMNNVKRAAISTIAGQVNKYLEKDPEENLPKLIQLEGNVFNFLKEMKNLPKM